MTVSITGNHILQVSRVGFVAGAERVMLTLAQGLNAAGHRVTVACASGGLVDAAKERGVDAIAFPFDRMRVSLDPRAYWTYFKAWRHSSRAMLEFCRDQRVTLLHAHHPVGVLYCATVARKLNLPIVLHVHETLPANWLYALALRVAARHVSHFICVSRAARELLDSQKIRGARVTTVHNGVDWSFLVDQSIPATLEGDGPHIGIFGVLEPRKGHDVFLEAAARVLSLFPKARFWIVGGLALKDKGAFAERVRVRADEGALAGHVTFTGHRDDVSSWMKAMDVVTMPSVAHESVGMSLIEAMTLGRPTVASRIGVTDEIIKPGVTGELADRGDPVSLADAIVGLLRADHETMGRDAARDMRARYSPAVFCENVVEIYRKLCPGIGPRQAPPLEIAVRTDS